MRPEEIKNLIESDPNFSEYLITELNHSFSHYRHLEKQMNSYLAFYSAFVVGSISVTVPLIFDTGNSFDTTLNNSFIFLMILIINMSLSVIVLGIIIKLRFALLIHYSKISWIREAFKNYFNNEFSHNDLVGVFDKNHPALKQDSTFGLFSFKKLNIRIVFYSGIILFVFIQLFIFKQFHQGIFQNSHFFSTITTSLCILFFHLFLFFKKKEFDDYTKEKKKSR